MARQVRAASRRKCFMQHYLRDERKRRLRTAARKELQRADRPVAFLARLRMASSERGDANGQG